MTLAAVVLCAAVAVQAPPSPSPAASPTGPVVVLQTSLGDIKIRLNQEKAPISVDNFLAYVKAHYYDGLIFHRVIPNFMIQGGGMGPDLVHKATRRPIKNEGGNGMKNLRGTVAMARTSDPDSATAEFFINVKDNAFLDRTPSNPGYAVFGEVTEGMDVVDKIVSSPTTTKGQLENVPVTPIFIKKAMLVTPGPAAKPVPHPAPPGAARPRARPSPSPRPH